MKLYRLALSVFLLAAFEAAAQEATCPPNIDPKLCSIAAATGGKVYNPPPGETAAQKMNRAVSVERQFMQQKQAQDERALNHTRPRPLNRRDIGCRDVANQRAQTICNAVAGALEYMIFPGPVGVLNSAHVITEAGVTKVFCNERVTSADMPAIKESLQQVTGRKPVDQRWIDASAQFEVILQYYPSICTPPAEK